MENIRQKPKILHFLEMTLFNREWFCIALLVFTYIASLIPIAVQNQNTARYVILWAAVVLFYDLFTNRWLFKFYGNQYLILFCIGAAITILLNGLTNFTSGIADFAYIVIIFFLFYTMAMSADKEKIRRYILKVTGLFSALLLLNTIASLVLLCLRYSIPFIWHLNGADRYYYMGVSAEGRFTGLQGNANLLGWLAMAGVCCCLILYAALPQKGRLMKVYSGVNLVIQWFCITLTESRGAALGFYGCLILFAVLLVITSEKMRIEKRAWQKVTACVAIFAFAGALWIGSGMVGKGVTTFLNQQYAQNDNKVGSQISRPLIGERDFEGNFSTGRTVLMKTGIKTVVNENLVFGVTSSNAPEEWLKYKPDNFTGELSDAGNMHNLFLQILLCNGVVGLLIFLMFLLYCLRITIRNVLMKKTDQRDQRLLIALLACLVGFGVISMVDNILIYPYTQLINYLFFLFMGWYVYYISLTYGKEAVRDPIFEFCMKPIRRLIERRKTQKAERSR